MTNAIDGRNTIAGFENAGVASPYGTALDLSTYTDSKICDFEISPQFSASERTRRNIGCGGDGGYPNDIPLGRFEYLLGLAGDFGYQNGADRLLANFFGAITSPAEQTTDQDDFLHVMTMAANPYPRFGTFAFKTNDTDVIELPSCFVQSINISWDNFTDYLQFAATLRSANAVFKIASVVNNISKLNSLVQLNASKVSPRCLDYFMIKPILDDTNDAVFNPATDKFPITSFNLSISRPLEQIDEMLGAACAKPSVEGDTEGTLTITMKEHKDNEKYSFSNWQDQEHFAFETKITGNQINAGDPESVLVRHPKMKLIESPDYNVTSSQKNPYTLNFRLMSSKNVINADFSTKATEIELVNERSAAYFAS